MKYLLKDSTDVIGVFLETAHPAKFKDVVEETLAQPVEIPAGLQKFLALTKRSIPMESDFASFKEYLLKTF
jgi:threonine synthase